VIYALNPTQIIRWVSLLTLALAVGMVWLSSPTAARDLWSAKSYVLAVPSLIIFLLTLRPVFKWVHGASFARAWLFPLLDGEWEGEIHSNWPRIRAMMEAARGDASTFNALSDPTPASAAAPPVKIRAKIESGLFDYCITLTMSETRHSRTVFVKPEWRRPDRPRLYYLYRQQEDGQVEVSDSSQHQGAAYLDYDVETDVLSGTYWTGRQFERGLNTAGRIRLARKFSKIG
jgi:hypothetical protein